MPLRVELGFSTKDVEFRGKTSGVDYRLDLYIQFKKRCSALEIQIAYDWVSKN